MSSEDRTNRPSSDAPSTGMPTDASGKPVNVVQRDLEDTSEDTKGVDEVITPSSTRAKEQEVDELQRKTDEIERKVADGN
jgi:hypothetical protein